MAIGLTALALTLAAVGTGANAVQQVRAGRQERAAANEAAGGAER